LENEIPRLENRQPPRSHSTPDSCSPPTSPITDEPSPITTPSPSPPSNSGSHTSGIKLQQDEDVSSPGRRISRKRRTQSAPSVSRTNPYKLLRRIIIMVCVANPFKIAILFSLFM
jgi:hypothetical protein